MIDFTNLENQLDNYIEWLANLSDYSDALPRLPDSTDVTLTISDINKLIFQTSNVYQQAVWYLGIAKGRLDSTKEQYNRAKAIAAQGNNSAQRQRNAAIDTQQVAEHVKVCQREVHLLQGLADAAQNASESIRKIANYIERIESGYMATSNTQDDFPDSF